MKKFEEEVKRPNNTGIDPFSKRDVSFEKLSSKFTKGAQTLKEWKEYAFKAEDRIRELESQLEKQQPEIPEFVGKYIKETADPIHEMCAWSEHYGDNGTKCDDPELSKMLDWFGMNRNMFYEAVIKGYTVKKKLFYLKDKNTKLYLWKDLETPEPPLIGVSFNDRHLDESNEFTQQEIDSMETGSYEQIEVEE